MLAKNITETIIRWHGGIDSFLKAKHVVRIKLYGVTFTPS